MDKKRRIFLKQMASLVAAGVIIPGFAGLLSSCKSNPEKNQNDKDKNQEEQPAELFFQISLAEWSLHRAIRNGEMTNLEFPLRTKKEFGIEAVEYVSTLFEKQEQAYLAELKNITDDNAVRNLLIMVDAEGNLGELDQAKRIEAVENHYKWVEAAKFLGCHSIRVNARGNGTPDEVAQAAADGLGRLAEFGKQHKINVIVENHGGYSSNGKWLSGVIQQVGSEYCGTLPDFGNFRIAEGEEYDRYQGVKELMPYAKGVSAKSHEFDANGNEVHTDYEKMLKIVKDSGYKGFIGIEYEGGELSEAEGIKATKELLLKAGKKVS